MLTVSCSFSAISQNSHILIDKNLIFKQDKTPEMVDNHNYTSYYTASNKVYNLKSIPVSKSASDVIDFKVSPAGYCYAVLTGKGKKYRLTVFDAHTPNTELIRKEGLNSPTAIEFNPDSRHIYVADGKSVHKLSVKDLEPAKTIAVGSNPSSLVMDKNGMYLAALADNSIEIYNEQEGSLRTELLFPSKVVDAEFSADGQLFMVICEDGTLETYGTRDFQRQNQYRDLGAPTSLSIHPDGKYIAVSTSDNKIQFLNLHDDFDRPYIMDDKGPKKYARFVTDNKGDVYITFDADESLVYKRLSGFVPNYSRVVNERVNELMHEWSKMRPMETEEEYRARMSPENIERQKRIFANEVTTGLAGSLSSFGNVTLGNYNPQTGLLTVRIGSLPPIYLQVPKEDMAGFGNGQNLQFENAVFGLTPNDNFELIYVDVFNPANKKRYSFDNLDRADLSYLGTDSRFVSLDLIMKSSREDVFLKELKNRIVDDAKAKNLISDHTQIKVDTRIEPAYDANGKSINNYKIAIGYTVDPGYSEKEDFPLGKYRMELSNAASSMMNIVKQAFETEFSSYIDKNKKLIIEVTGSADGSPILNGIPYDGGYGIFENEPVRINGELNSISVSPHSGIKTNEQLAFLRA